MNFKKAAALLIVSLPGIGYVMEPGDIKELVQVVRDRTMLADIGHTETQGPGCNEALNQPLPTAVVTAAPPPGTTFAGFSLRQR